METHRERLGQYEILGPLGAGGMGEVYVARDPVLGRKVAIKVLSLRLSGDRETLTRFTQEARSASALNHPNIVTIYEVGVEDGTPYIVMEYIEGRDLRSLVANGPLPNRKTLDIGSQIADGLAAAHEQGIIHRDLKPENLMFTKDGFVKILDFGLAKIVRGTPSDTDDTLELDLPATNPGTILGTVGYMSPEQATGKALDFRSDQFALGAILYELATGRVAFDRATAIDTLSAILHEDPPSVGRYNAKMPPPFSWIVERLLSKEPEERYASTRDLARELRTLRERAATESADYDGIPRPPVWAPLLHSSRAPMLALGFALIIAAGGIYWIERDHMRPPAGAAQQAKKYLAVMRFQDLTGDKNGQLVLDGFAETLSARLAHFPSLQVMRPANTADAAVTAPQLARDLGANVILTGSMQRNGDRIRVAYALFDATTQTETGRDLIEGSVSDLFGVQDKLADSVAASLKLGGAPAAAAAHAPALDDAASQRRYLEALGSMRHYDDPASIDNAIHILEDISSKNESASALAALGRAYLYKYQLSKDATWATKAGLTCEKASRADPQNPDVHYTLGELRRQTGRHDEAIAAYRRALAQQPNNAEAVLGLAETYKAVGKLQDAEREYKHGIDLLPKFWSGYNKLGAFYASHGRLDEAAAMFRRVTELAPDNMRGYINLGGTYQQMGRPNDAIAVFEKAIARKPNAQAYSNLGTTYYFIGDYERAASAYENATKLEPANSLTWANLADAYRRIDGAAPKSNAALDRAIDAAKGELTIDPGDARVHARLALCLARRQRLVEARLEMSRALQIDPTNPNTMYRAAIIANVAGQTASARELLKRALTLGYSAAEAEKDPDFANLRGSDIFHN